MLAEDRLRIGNFGTDIVIEPDDFTSDRDALYKVLHSDLQKEGPTPLWNAIDRAIDKLLLEKSRRVVLAMSDGVDEPFDFSGHAKSMKGEMKRAEDNIMIHAVGRRPGADASTWILETSLWRRPERMVARLQTND